MASGASVTAFLAVFLMLCMSAVMAQSEAPAPAPASGAGLSAEMSSATLALFSMLVAAFFY